MPIQAPKMGVLVDRCIIASVIFTEVFT